MTKKMNDVIIQGERWTMLCRNHGLMELRIYVKYGLAKGRCEHLPFAV